MKLAVTFQVALPVCVRQVGKFFVSFCPVLDVYTQGPTQAKAISNLSEALQLFLVNCYERGTLGKVLEQSGFKPISKLTRRGRTTKQHLPEDYRMLSVPIPFMIDKRRDELCPA